jgi:hypothetical protein
MSGRRHLLTGDVNCFHNDRRLCTNLQQTVFNFTLQATYLTKFTRLIDIKKNNRQAARCVVFPHVFLAGFSQSLPDFH